MRRKGEMKVYLNLEMEKKALGQVVIKLYPQYAPKTCENFRLLCTGEAGYSKKTGKLLSYKGSIFHRIIPGFMMQGGDFTKFNGTGNESAYNTEGLAEEASILKHSKSGIVSMAKNDSTTNGSQFFITFGPAPWLDNMCTAFGEVIKGMEVCGKVENVRTDANDKPMQRIEIVNCGEVVEKQECSASERRSNSSERCRRRRSESLERDRHGRRKRSRSLSKKRRRHHKQRTKQ
eukprot:TRINITY_DN63_c1_g1_i1.p1 TRINITY_DN63_c1_g1~~TRINITY_DN63_c1_g1_i1.p1  ORF type:complete len:233 (+),score=50.61 TRINITY_DN63_c1_g1_i1:66-764(+)